MQRRKRNVPSLSCPGLTRTSNRKAGDGSSMDCGSSPAMTRESSDCVSALGVGLAQGYAPFDGLAVLPTRARHRSRPRQPFLPKTARRQRAACSGAKLATSKRACASRWHCVTRRAAVNPSTISQTDRAGSRFLPGHRRKRNVSLFVMPGLDPGIHPQGRRWLQYGLPGQARQ